MITLINANALHIPLRDESVDLIFCDPPYSDKFAYLYSWLAEEAARILKLGGFCLAMCGGLRLFDNMKCMAEHLEWFWNYEVLMTNVSTVIWPRRTIARNKPLLAFSKGPGMPRTNVLSAYLGGGNDKRFHAWGQDVASARYYIDCFSKPGDLVVDPMVGGGTTAIASSIIGRRFVGLDIDVAALRVSRERIRAGDLLHQLPLFTTRSSLDGSRQLYPDS